MHIPGICLSAYGPFFVLLSFRKKYNDTLKICNDDFEEQGLNFYLVLVLSLATLLFS